LEDEQQTLTYVLKRIAYAVPVIIGITLISFVIAALTPGNPVTTQLGASPNTSPALAQHLIAQYGLNKPLYIQYFYFLGRLVQGNFGTDLETGVPVLGEVLQALPRTILLAIASLAIAIPIGMFLGIFSARHRNSKLDTVSTVGSLVAASIPNFWLGLVLILVFGFYLSIFPMSGYGSPAQIVLPALTLGLFVAGGITRFTRSSMLEVLNQDFVRAAKARGLRERVVIYRHALKNALIPVVTVIGLYFGTLLSGAVVVENIFGWPGIGTMAFNAITVKNYPVIQATILVASISFVLVNLGVDLLYAYIDPRIQYDKTRG
jgi:peptide/nickel transport system permease protein